MSRLSRRPRARFSAFMNRVSSAFQERSMTALRLVAGLLLLLLTLLRARLLKIFFILMKIIGVENDTFIVIIIIFSFNV